MRRERGPIAGFDVKRPNGNEKRNDCQLEHDHGRIKAGALADAAHQNPCDQPDNENRRQVEDERQTGNAGRRIPGLTAAQDRIAECGQVEASRFGSGDFVTGLQRGAIINSQPYWPRHMKDRKQTLKIVRPGNRHGHVADGVFKNQVPADDPGDEFAQGGIGISVGRAGDRHHGSKFRVTQSGEPAGDGHQDE